MEKQRKPGFLHDPISRSKSEGFCLAAKWPCVLNPSSTSVTKAVTTKLCFPNLVWPNTRTFHPSHVSTLTLDPNWPLLRQERLVYPAEVFKFCLWNLTVPRGFLLPGWGIENWQTQTTRVPVLALMAGPSNRISRLSSSGWTKPHSWQVTRRANSTSKELSFQPVSKLREQEWGLCSHLNTYKAKLS